MRVALAGDTMLGRMVGDQLSRSGNTQLFSPEVIAVARGADLFLLNLECVISNRGQRWPDPSKPFFFRTPPSAVEVLLQLGVDCVTLANNHSLDYGHEALTDTLNLLRDAGIATAGAGMSERMARAPVVLDRCGQSVAIVAVTDHPAAYAAGPSTPGVAYADLRRASPAWLLETVGRLQTDIVIVSPHWGPNMVAEPVPHVRRSAAELMGAGATLIAGHSAHVFHGIHNSILYDVGDFIDDYATDHQLRNDLGLLFLVTFSGAAITRIEAIPLALDYCHTRLADEDERRWIFQRMRAASRPFGTEVTEQDGRLVVTTSHFETGAPG